MLNSSFNELHIVCAVLHSKYLRSCRRNPYLYLRLSSIYVNASAQCPVPIAHSNVCECVFICSLNAE